MDARIKSGHDGAVGLMLRSPRSGRLEA